MALSAHFEPLFGATWATLGDFWDHFGPILAQKEIGSAERKPQEIQESPKRAPKSDFAPKMRSKWSPKWIHLRKSRIFMNLHPVEARV